MCLWVCGFGDVGCMELGNGVEVEVGELVQTRGGDGLNRCWYG